MTTFEDLALAELRRISSTGGSTGSSLAIQSGESHIGEVGGNTAQSSATFTRPADTTAYAISDVVCDSTSAPTVLTFANVARLAAGSGYITTARLVKSTNTTTNANFRLYLYAVAPTAINDNSQFTLLWANRSNRIGHIDFSSMGTEGTGSDSASALATATAIKFICASGSTTLYGVLVAKAAYTPASAEQFYVELAADRN